MWKQKERDVVVWNAEDGSLTNELAEEWEEVTQ